MEISKAQLKTHDWFNSTFKRDIQGEGQATDRANRFVEEALELVQAIGITKESIRLQLDRVYSRPVGEVKQEIGGTILTLSLIASSQDLLMDDCWSAAIEDGYARQAKIRAKDAAKRKDSPLPGDIDTVEVAPVLDKFKGCTFYAGVNTNSVDVYYPVNKDNREVRARPFCRIRGWGYLTGNGNGALGLPSTAAIIRQHKTSELIAHLLNLHFNENYPDSNDVDYTTHKARLDAYTAKDLVCEGPYKKCPHTSFMWGRNWKNTDNCHMLDMAPPEIGESYKLPYIYGELLANLLNEHFGYNMKAPV